MKRLFAFILAAFLLATPVLAAGSPDSRSADPSTCAHHFEVSVVREATCSQKGLLAYTCAKCGLTYTAETLPDEDAHTYELTGCTATCTEDGETIYTCSGCGASYTEPAPATGHVPEEESASCTEPVLCSVCGEVLTPPAGHDYVYQYDAQFGEDGALTDYGTWKCSKCGETMAATRGNAEEYYGLTEPAPEEDGSGTDLLLVGSEPYGDDSPTDGDVPPAAPEAGGGADSPSDADTAPDAGSPTDAPVTDRRTGLWITISAVVLCVVIVEAVVLTGSLKKDKTTL